MTMNFNISPFFDDYDPAAEFYKILFRPGYAVQTRELNQLQSILQNQITSLGKHLFDEGSVVVPGNILLNNNMAYVTIQPINSIGLDVSKFVKNMEGRIVTGKLSGVTAVVVHVELANGLNPTTLYIRYIASGVSTSTDHSGITTTNTPENIFLDNEIIISDDINAYSVTSSQSTQLSSNNSTGFGTIASISDGIYYINGYFTTVAYANVVVSPYVNFNSHASEQPTAIVGIVWTENIITSDDDQSLLDNASGAPNYSAPGADRYNISTTFELILPIGNNSVPVAPNKFVNLISIDRGSVTITQNIPAYNELNAVLAKRTYDESGDFIVSDFTIGLREQRMNFRGNWSPETPYIIGDIIEGICSGQTYTYECVRTGTSGTYPPTFIADFGDIFNDASTQWEFVEQFYINDGLNSDPTADSTNYIVEVSKGTAMVHGYEYVSQGLTRVLNNKARDYDRVANGNITAYDGTYVLVDTLYSFPDRIGSAFQLIQLRDQYSTTAGIMGGNLVGTAQIRWIEQDSGSGYFRAYLCNIDMNSKYTFSHDVKQLFCTNLSSSNFSANVVPTYSPSLKGSITCVDGIVNGVGTLFTTQLNVGDYISWDTTNYSKVARVLEIINNNSLSIDDVTASLSDSAFSLISSTVYNPNVNSSIFAFSHNYIRNAKEPNDFTNNTRYTITRNLGTILSGASSSNSVDTGSITYSLSASNETFANTGNVTNYLIMNVDTGIPCTAVNGVAVVTSNNSSTITITGIDPITQYNIFATIEKTASQRIKSLAINTISHTDANSLSSPILSLMYPDCNRILSIRQAPAFGAITAGNLATLDVSSLFTFDSGQRSLFYDIGSISKISPQVKITGSLEITYEYFTHSAGDYFSVDSYSNVIPYSEIEPQLRDTLDFRPVLTMSAERTLGGVEYYYVPEYLDITYCQQLNTLGSTNSQFDSSLIGIPKSGYDVFADYSYYLPRIDALVVSTDLSISIIEGVSKLTPSPPDIPYNAMALYYIGNTPYGDNPKQSVLLTAVDNRHFTMKDIGKLEDRITTLEYYVSLTIQEQQTANLSIKDTSGLEMFKNGFIVEAFNDHGIGDVANPDYSCFINSTTNQLYPQLNVTSIPLSEINTSNAQRTSNNYVINDGLITLPFTEVVYVSNNKASRVENINPFAIANFNGNLNIYPSSDTWFDTVSLPTVYNTI